MKRRLVSRYVGSFALLIGGLGGCIVFVPNVDSDVGEVCHFSGESSTCGSCVAQSCKLTLSACCGDSACGETLTLLDSCATSQKQCKSLGNKTSAPSPASENLVSCINALCGSECQTTTGATSNGKTFVTNCTKGADSCSCTVPTSGSSSAPNANSCGTATVENALCCADSDWPNPGASCTCEPYRCDDTFSGCQCAAGGSGSFSLCTNSKGGVCCRSVSSASCHCGTTTCTSAEVQVTDCSYDGMGCGESKTYVNACALTE